MISVVVPCYNESNNIEICYKRITENLLLISQIYEIIFVDDGSTDNTFSKLYSISEIDKKVNTNLNETFRSYLSSNIPIISIENKKNNK